MIFLFYDANTLVCVSVCFDKVLKNVFLKVGSQKS